MRYEPVGYIVEYEVSALVFLLVVMLRYFGARRFPNQKSRMFALVLWVTAADIILDVVSAWIIDNVFRVPLAITFLANEAFYSLQIVLPMLMALYTLAMVDHLNRRRLRRLLPLLLPAVSVLLLLLSNPLTHWYFYVDPVRGYVHGTLFLTTYAACLFYMVVTFVVTFRNRAILRRDEYSTIFRFLGVVLVAMLVQYLYPALLISGVAIALSVVLMYFTLQNPDTMLDTTTGAFTYEAMLAFLSDRMGERERVQIVAVKVHNMARINELLGIENGSLLLREISRFLRESANGAWVFRMRGNCFVAITRRREDYEGLRERLDSRVARPWLVGENEILVQATVCCVATDELLAEPISPEEAVYYLETVFLQNERFGSRVKSIAVGAELLERIERSRAVETALREALESGEGLELYFQPLWSVRQRRFVSAEALLRFSHPLMGPISPEKFVPIAESNGLVTAMDEMVVRKACEFIKDCGHGRALGLEAIEINLSALEFMHRRLPELLNAIMAQYGVDPAFLCFEITETAATESFEVLKECMQELRNKGCRFALDDFGTGYANISQVIQLPFSMVKLDRSLLFGPEVVMEDMARMFARMDRRTVIEGVETAEQVARIEALQVDYIQGYYYAKPMSGPDFLRFLQDNAPSEGPQP